MIFIITIKKKPKRDKIKNKIIRENLKLESITDIIKEGQMRWFGQLSRIKEDSFTKKDI